MPKEEKYTHLQRYKALILRILTNYPYEKCLTEPKCLEKKANDLVRSILSAITMEEMQALLTEAYDFVAYHTVKEQVSEKKKWKLSFGHLNIDQSSRMMDSNQLRMRDHGTQGSFIGTRMNINIAQ